MFVGRSWVRFLLSYLRHERSPSNPNAVLLFSFLAMLVLLSFSHVQVICRHRRSIWLIKRKFVLFFFLVLRFAVLVVVVFVVFLQEFFLVVALLLKYI
jgi:hypothetical protein